MWRVNGRKGEADVNATTMEHIIVDRDEKECSHKVRTCTGWKGGWEGYALMASRSRTTTSVNELGEET